MSLLNQYAHKCVKMILAETADGAGGYTTAFSEGAEVTCYVALDGSNERKAAENKSVDSSFTILVDDSASVSFGDILKDKTSDGFFRITSKPDEKVAPASSSLRLKSFTAERWEQPS